MIGKHVVIDTLDNFKTKLSQIPSSAIVLIKDVGQIYAHGTYFGAQKTYSLLTKTADGLAPKGGTSASSQIKDGETEWVLTVTNGENPSWRRLPDNAFNSLQYTLPAATTTELGGIKVGKQYTATFSDLVGKYYKINIDKDGLAYVEVPWTDNDYRVEQVNTSVLDEDFRVTFSGTATNDTKTETLRKSSKLLFNPVSGKLASTTFEGNLDGKYINKLTGYAIAKQEAAISVNDSLNQALGKLEYKLDSAYNWYKGISETDDDSVINKWTEIVDFVDSITEGTDIITKFVTTDTDQDITGTKTYKSPIKIEGGHDFKLVLDNTQTGNDNKFQYIGFSQNGTMYGMLGTDRDNTLVWNGYKIYNSNNLTNLSQLTDDVVSGKYLPITGGTLTSSLYIGNVSNTAYNCLGLIRSGFGLKINNLPDGGYISFSKLNSDQLEALSTIYLLPNDLRLSFDGNKTWNTVWHSGNDGVGSGLDADLLDGYQSSKFYRKGNDVIGGKNLINSIVSGKNTSLKGTTRYPKIELTISTGDTYFYIKLSEDIEANEKLVFSFDVSGVNVSNLTWEFLWKNHPSEGMVAFNKNGRYYMYVTNVEKVTANSVILIDDWNKSLGSQTSVITLSNFKLERGELGTDFSWNPDHVVLNTEDIDSDYLNGIDSGGFIRQLYDTESTTTSQLFNKLNQIKSTYNTFTVRSNKWNLLSEDISFDWGFSLMYLQNKYQSTTNVGGGGILIPQNGDSMYLLSLRGGSSTDANVNIKAIRIITDDIFKDYTAEKLKLSTPVSIWGQSFDGTYNIIASRTNALMSSKGAYYGFSIMPAGQPVYGVRTFLTYDQGQKMGAYEISADHRYGLVINIANNLEYNYNDIPHDATYDNIITFKNDKNILIAGNTTFGTSDKASTNYKIYVDGISYLNNNLLLNGDLRFKTTGNISWDSGEVQQRFLVTDSSDKESQAFTFQNSFNTGNTWSDLVTITNNGKLKASQLVLNSGFDNKIIINNTDSEQHSSISIQQENVEYGAIVWNKSTLKIRGIGNLYYNDNKVLTSNNYTSYFGYIGKTKVQASSEDQDLKGIKKLEATDLISGSGFMKIDSSDDYVLLGGGGHKSISDIVLGTVTTVITKNLALNTDWKDSGIVLDASTFPNGSGSYVVQVSKSNTNNYLWTGVMSVLISTSVTKSMTSEILMHGNGFDIDTAQLYLRTVQDTSTKKVKLQIAYSGSNSAVDWTFKFKKLI